jgi:hypothetical protein
MKKKLTFRNILTAILSLVFIASVISGDTYLIGAAVCTCILSGFGILTYNELVSFKAEYEENKKPKQ